MVRLELFAQEEATRDGG